MFQKGSWEIDEREAKVIASVNNVKIPALTQYFLMYFSILN